MFTDDQIKQLAKVIDERLEYKFSPIEKRLDNLEQGQKSLEQGQIDIKKSIVHLEEKLSREMKDVGVMINQMGIYLDKRFERIENELNLPPFSQKD